MRRPPTKPPRRRTSPNISDVIVFHRINAAGAAPTFRGALSAEARAACATGRGAGDRPRPRGAYLVSDDRDELVGSCTFLSAPVDGQAGVFFTTFAGRQGCGHATAMLAALLKIAHGAAPGIVLTAHTGPEESAATRVLEKCGFVYQGMVNNPDSGLLWEWHHLS